MPRSTLLAPACLALLAAGCADGPVPEARYLNPWVRKQWQQDEQAITTYHRKVSDLAALRSQARRLPPQQQESVAAELASRLTEEQAPAMRSELIRTLGEFPLASARTAVQGALADETPRVRIAACQALARFPAADSVEPLAQMIAGDTDLDVRIAAASSLGRFSDDTLPAEERMRLAQLLRPALDDRDPALQVAAMQSLATITGKTDFRNSAPTWRQFLDGGNPTPPPPPTLAELVERSVNWY